MRTKVARYFGCFTSITISEMVAKGLIKRVFERNVLLSSLEFRKDINALFQIHCVHTRKGNGTGF